MLRSAIVLVGVITTTGCKAKVPAPPAPVAPARPVDAAVAVWSTAIAPPSPYDRFRPRMSHADFVAMVADAGLVSTRSAVPSRLAVPGDATVYATAIPGAFAYFLFADDGSVSGIVFVAGLESPLGDEVTAQWGKGSDGAGGYESPAGWRVRFVEQERQTLAFSAERAEIGAVARASSTLWSDLGGLIGKPPSAAGPVLQLANDHALVATDWDDDPWDLVPTVDATGHAITMITATGRTDSEDARIALVRSLTAAFGSPHTIVTEAGRIEIACTTDTLEVRLGDSADEWTIAIRARSSSSPSSSP